MVGREVIHDDGGWMLKVKEQDGQYCISHHPTGDRSGIAVSCLWVSETEFDALCRWWLKKNPFLLEEIITNAKEAK